jgi:hypothetical protein
VQNFSPMTFYVLREGIYSEPDSSIKVASGLGVVSAPNRRSVQYGLEGGHPRRGCCHVHSVAGRESSGPAGMHATRARSATDRLYSSWLSQTAALAGEAPRVGQQTWMLGLYNM